MPRDRDCGSKDERKREKRGFSPAGESSREEIKVRMKGETLTQRRVDIYLETLPSQYGFVAAQHVLL